MAKENKTIKEYIALFEYRDGEDGFSVVFPDLDGCYSAGDNYDDAVRMAHEALALYADENDNMPEPRTIEQIRSKWPDWSEWEKNYKFLIGKIALYPMKSETQRFNVSMPADIVARIDRVARNRSAFLLSAAEYMLSRGVARQAGDNRAGA
jgi:predicted RNase H-like HicB family nuclease